MINFAGLGYNYLTLVSNAIKEMKKQGNNKMIITDSKSEWNIFESQTNWADFNIAIPLLFNFYHGIELIMKAILYKSERAFNANHKLDDLCSELKSIDPNPCDLINIFEKHLNVQSSPFKKFFEDNNLRVPQFYLAFKYPAKFEKKNKIQFTPYNFESLKYLGNINLERFEVLRQDIESIKPAINKWNQERNRFIND